MPQLSTLVMSLAHNFALNTHTHTHTPLNGLLSRTARVSRYQQGQTDLDFTEARDSEWQWHQLGHMQVSTSLQTDNHANTQCSVFFQARCPSCRPTNSVKALKAFLYKSTEMEYEVEVPDQEANQRGCGDTLWKRTAKHVN